MSTAPMRFRSLPLAVKLAVMLTYFMTWVLFAELIIDRHGLDRYLPLYRVGNFCPYDIAVLLILTFAWWRAHRNA